MRYLEILAVAVLFSMLTTLSAAPLKYIDTSSCGVQNGVLLVSRSQCLEVSKEMLTCSSLRMISGLLNGDVSDSEAQRRFDLVKSLVDEWYQKCVASMKIYFLRAV